MCDWLFFRLNFCILLAHHTQRNTFSESTKTDDIPRNDYGKKSISAQHTVRRIIVQKVLTTWKINELRIKLPLQIQKAANQE